MAELRPPIESGAPDPMPYMHPVMVKNYGKWVFPQPSEAGCPVPPR
jgi:dissimilatory sulfite reductase beta subunit